MCHGWQAYWAPCPRIRTIAAIRMWASAFRSADTQNCKTNSREHGVMWRPHHIIMNMAVALMSRSGYRPLHLLEYRAVGVCNAVLNVNVAKPDERLILYRVNQLFSSVCVCWHGSGVPFIRSHIKLPATTIKCILFACAHTNGVFLSCMFWFSGVAIWRA